jgi:hypothetical protein
VSKKPTLRVVGGGTEGLFDEQDDADPLFVDYGSAAKKPRRSKAPKTTRKTFAQIPHDRAIKLCRHRIGDAAWGVLFELDYLAFKGKNPVPLSGIQLRKIGIARNTRIKALQKLEAAGAVKVTSRGKGKAPLVTYLWRR